MANVVLPIGINFKNWSDQLRQDIPNITLPIAGNVRNWREWASQVVNDNALSFVPVPTALCYPNEDDWKIWASYFIDSVNNLTNT